MISWGGNEHVLIEFITLDFTPASLTCACPTQPKLLPDCCCPHRMPCKYFVSNRLITIFENILFEPSEAQVIIDSPEIDFTLLLLLLLLLVLLLLLFA